jgi:calcineurin-like phosphoesterase family protein
MVTHRAVASAIFALALGSLAAAQRPEPLVPLPACLTPDPCQRAPRAGEIAIAFVGDAGYGPGGASEWGTHAQSEVAKRMEELCPRPDLVLFLGDNIYWHGSPELFGPRFDTVYPRLLDAEGRRVHAALGNHDVEGCQIVEPQAFPAGETCSQALVRLLREDVKQEAEVPPLAHSPERVLPDILTAAAGVPARECLSAFDAVYQQSQTATRKCFAGPALRHPAFGFGMRGESRLRYYTVDRTAPPGPAGARPPALRVVLADSNTLDVRGRLSAARQTSGAPVGEAPSDRLQALWVENQLRTAPAGAWTFLAMHHPVFTPRGCVIKLFGSCVGGHDDQEGLRHQLWPESRSNPWPDLVLVAHNHIYARSQPLDAAGQPREAAGGPVTVRHFVSGGGGAPLYRVLDDARFANRGAFHHFVYLRLRADEAFFWTIDQHRKVRDAGCFRKGEKEDRCITAGSYSSDALTCGPPLPAGQKCPMPAR